jgi:hypothetical protein
MSSPEDPGYEADSWLSPEENLVYLDALIVRLAAVSASLTQIPGAGECGDCRHEASRRYEVGRFALCHTCSVRRVNAKAFV